MFQLPFASFCSTLQMISFLLSWLLSISLMEKEANCIILMVDLYPVDDRALLIFQLWVLATLGKNSGFCPL